MTATHSRLEEGEDGVVSSRPLKRARTSTEPDGTAADNTQIIPEENQHNIISSLDPEDEEEEEDRTNEVEAPRASDLYLDTVCIVFLHDYSSSHFIRSIGLF